jgi:hypothetical protein
MEARTMRRLCFHTESDRFVSLLGVLDPGSRFDCAVVYDEENNKYLEFRNDQAAELIDCLATADELISCNGREHDLCMLENVCGENRVAPLRKITHHDLCDLHSLSSLNDLVRRYNIPEDRLREIEQARDNRLKAAEERWPEERTGWRSGDDYFIERQLARAWYDVERTYLVFKAYLATRELAPSAKRSQQ